MDFVGALGNQSNKQDKDRFQSNQPTKIRRNIYDGYANGSARHQHHISNYSLTNVKTENGIATYSGLATVTMKAGPVANVPVEIKIINNNGISNWFDPAKVEKHFGESPIYGTVFTKKDMESKGSLVPKA